jgi:excisionase family DNA binding protein
MGEDTRQTGLTIGEAARLLRISPEGVRKRIKRGQLKAYKVDNRWLVVLDGHDKPPNVPDKPVEDQSGTGWIIHQQLIAHLQDEVAYLRSQLNEQLSVKDAQIGKLLDDIEFWREQVRYKELQIAQLHDRVIELPSPEEPEPDEQEPEPQPAAAPAAESGNVLSRFWRWVVGGE